MSESPTGYAFNRTRQAYLATRLSVAKTHWSRLRGLMWTDPKDFLQGQGLWIVPSHGVHTFAMRFPIDVLYLTTDNAVLHIEHNLRPWRVAPVRGQAASVLELPGEALASSGTAIGDKIEITMGRVPEVATA